jgi:uncharacterized protein
MAERTMNAMKCARSVVVALVSCAAVFAGPGAQTREPIIDMHMHALAADDNGPPGQGMCTPIASMPVWDQRLPYPDVFTERFLKPPCADPVWAPKTDVEVMTQTFEIAKRRNVIGVVSGPVSKVDAWLTAAEPGRLIPGLSLQLGEKGTPSVAMLRARHTAGQLDVLGEVTNQYAGILPDDPRMEPYWALAEQRDIPVGIHIGTGPPGVIYLNSPKYRAAMHSALTLEPVLVKHPKLRVYVMHAGYPMLDDLLALLYAHPQVYVDTGVIVYTQPRPAFYRYLQGIIDAGFGKRVMFGSDQMVWPGTIERALAVIEDAPFLSADQKRDILYNNAARFLRLSDETQRKHRGM